MKQQVKVWDFPTRVFHWSLVLLFGGMWYSGKQGGDWLEWHIRAGVVLAVLLLFRLLWGMLGSETSRFRHFVRHPADMLRYLRGDKDVHDGLGHNPLGGVMVLVMLLALLFQVGSGLFSADVDSYLYDGPLAARIGELAESVTGWHKQGFNLLLGLAGLHLLAIVFYRLVKRRNLVGPMVTGYATVEGEARRLEFAPPVIALVSLVVSAGAVYFLLTRL